VLSFLPSESVCANTDIRLYSRAGDPGLEGFNVEDDSTFDVKAS
jgi:hypothetical protein